MTLFNYQNTNFNYTQNGHFAYSYKLRPGISRDSHGLKVAQLAGMPTPAIQVASKALAWLDRNQQYTTMLSHSDAFETMRTELDIQTDTTVR